MNKAYPLLLLIFVSISFLSCSEVYNTEEGISGIRVETDVNSQIIGQEVTISVVTEGGEDITDRATIYANDEVLSSPTFTTQDVGSVELKATYLGLESSVIEIEYLEEPETIFVKRVLIEDYTGTWCGWCPRVSYAMKLLSEQTDNAVFVAIHRAPAGTQDPYNYESADELELLINRPGYPKGFINRLTQWNFPEPDNVSQAIAFTQGSNPKLGLKMSSSFTSNQVNLTVNALFKDNFTDLKLVVYLLEDGLVYPQVNYTSYFGGEDPIQEYVHDYTLRETLTNIIGDQLDDADTREDSEFSRSFSFILPDNVSNASNVDFVAFLTDQEGNVINVRNSSLGEDQEYELIVIE